MKVSIIMLTGLGAAACLRGRSAALRHWVIAVAMACAGLMPVLVPFLPSSPLRWALPADLASRAGFLRS